MGEMERPAAEAGDGRDDSELICPWCGSRRSEQMGEFGPQLLSSQHICLDCGSPFEVIRSRTVE
jgi:DNA-directed RNA polymerase subunit RPC12/RpoP